MSTGQYVVEGPNTVPAQRCPKRAENGGFRVGRRIVGATGHPHSDCFRVGFVGPRNAEINRHGASGQQGTYQAGVFSTLR